MTFLPPSYFDCVDNLQLCRVQDFDDFLNWLFNFFMRTQKVSKWVYIFLILKKIIHEF